MRTIGKLGLDGLLSFAPDSEPFAPQGLNVLIGPNGSGKSNLIEALELLAATPYDLAGVVRDGGGPAEWLWKGPDGRAAAAIEVELEEGTPTRRPLRYRLGFTAVQSRLEVVDEAIEELEPTNTGSATCGAWASSAPTREPRDALTADACSKYSAT